MRIHTQARIRGAVALAFLLALSLVATLPAFAQTETVLHSFAGARDGGYPASRRAHDKNE